MVSIKKVLIYCIFLVFTCIACLINLGFILELSGLGKNFIKIEGIEFKTLYQPVLKIESINLQPQKDLGKSQIPNYIVSLFLNIFSEIHLKKTHIGTYHLNEIVIRKKKWNQFYLKSHDFYDKDILISIKKSTKDYQNNDTSKAFKNLLIINLNPNLKEFEAQFHSDYIQTKAHCMLQQDFLSCSIDPTVINNSQIKINVDSLHVKYPITSTRKLSFNELELSLEASLYNQVNDQECIKCSASKEKGEQVVDINYNDRQLQLQRKKSNNSSWILRDKELNTTIGIFQYDNHHVTFDGQLNLTLLHPIIYDELTVNNMILHQAALALKEQLLSINTKLCGTWKEVIGLDNQLHIKVSNKDIDIHGHAGTLNSYPLKEISYNSNTQKTKVTIAIDQTDLLGTLDYHSRYLAPQNGLLTYQKFQDQQTYNWQPLERQSMDSSVIQINKLVLSEKNNHNTIDASLTWDNFDIRCHGKDFDQNFLSGKLTCSASTKANSPLAIGFTAQGVKSGSIIHGDLKTSGELPLLPNLDPLSFEYDCLKNILTLTSDVHPDDMTHLKTNTSQDNFLYTHINFDTQGIKVRSSHKQLVISELLQEQIASLISPPSTSNTDKQEWTIDGLSHIKKLTFNKLDLSNTTLTLQHNLDSRSKASFNSSYLDSKGSIAFDRSGISLNFESLNLDQLYSLIQSYNSNSASNGIFKGTFSMEELFNQTQDITLNCEQTTWKNHTIGALSVKGIYNKPKELLNIYHFDITSEDLDHHAASQITNKSIISSGTVTLKSLPAFLKEKLNLIGIISAHGEVAYNLEFSPEHSVPVIKVHLLLKDCQVMHKNLQSIKVLDFLSGRFIENSKVRLTNKAPFLIDEIEMQIDMTNKSYAQIPYCVIKAGPLVSAFKGRLTAQSIDGEVTIVPRVTKFLPTAAFASGQFLIGSASLLLDAILGDELSKIASEHYVVSGPITNIQVTKKL